MTMPSIQNDGFNPFSVALYYRKAGWLGTIPVPYNEKHPPPKGFTGAGAPYPDDEKVQLWLQNERNNIALRLAETDHLPKASPYQTKVYELLGIDVDDYGEKTGWEQLQALEAKLGKLQPTVCSSSRWEQSPNSGIRLYLVPAGLHFLGKADSAIEIIQRAHRYMLVWPSINPDVADMPNGARYRFKGPGGAYYERNGEGAAIDPLAAIPPLEDVAVLPEAWLDYLTCNRMIATGEEISSLSMGELMNWAKEAFNDSQGDMCRMMSNAADKKLSELENCVSHHDLMTKFHWHILKLGEEGHSGWIRAMTAFNKPWADKTNKDRGGVPISVLQDEITRSVIGCLSKIEPNYHGYIPEDTCAATVTSLHDVDIDSFHVNVNEDSDYTESGGGDDFGPTIRRTPKNHTESGGYGQSDEDNARHFIDVYGDNLKFITSRRNWVLWDGLNWHKDGSDDIIATAAFRVVRARQTSHASKLPRSDAVQIKKSNAALRWAQRSGMKQPILNAIQLARAKHFLDEPVATVGNEFDRNPTLLGCENGVLVLGKEPYLRAPKKEDYVTYNTHTTYIPWGTNEADEVDLLEGYKLWNEYLGIFLPDTRLRHFIQKVMGHLLFGGNPEKLLIFVYGPHDTGKSTILGGIKAALGDYYGTVDINLFNNQKLNPGLIRAVPLRVAGMSEVEEGNMDANMIKRLTGNDTITAEAKFSNEIFEGSPQFTPVIALNQEPKIKNVDEALQERIIVLPFNFQIPMEDRDYGRQTEIAASSSEAVLSWLVEGWKMYAKEGLKRQNWPVEVQALCGNVVGNLNATQRFITECIEKSTPSANEARREAFQKAHRLRKTTPSVSDWDQEWTPIASAVNEMYQRWCVANNEKTVSITELIKEIGCGKAEVRNINGTNHRCYIGFRLKGVEE
jgi:P4 family phage/plasmid primase-like protien